MENERSIPIKVKLQDGEVILVDTSTTVFNPEEDVISLDSVFDFRDISPTIQALATDIKSIFDEIKPNKATIEFGLQIGVESGKLTALLVKGTGTANLKVTFEWGKQ